MVAAEPGPPRSQRHHERAGLRLYELIEAPAATIEAEWAEQAGAPRLQKLPTTLSDLLTHRQGQPGEAAALNPARSCHNLGSTGMASVAAAPVISARSASASARAGLLCDGG